MKKQWIGWGMVMALAFCLVGEASAQTKLEPNVLKTSPTQYKNVYIQIKDIFINIRAAIPLQFIKAGYSADKYLTFGARNAGMRCFLRRDTINEKTVGQLNNGDQVTIYGYVKEPKATVADDTRFEHKEKVNYVIEVSKIEKGWVD